MFWAYDVPLSIFLKFLIDAADERLALGIDQWLVEATYDWRVNIAVGGSIALTIDEEWSQNQIDTIIELCRTAITAIRLSGDLPAREIESWPIIDDSRIFTRGHDPVPCEPVARLGEVFVSLLQNKLPKPPEGNYWFCTLYEHVQTEGYPSWEDRDLFAYYRELREYESRGVIQKIVMHMQQNGCEGMEVKLDPYKNRVLAIRRKDRSIAGEVAKSNIRYSDSYILRKLLFPQSNTVMIEPPAVLDGATVLWVTPTSPDMSYGFDWVVNENQFEPISALAICQYPGKDYFNVFACNAQWRVKGDQVYNSVDEAKIGSEQIYETAPIYWVRLRDN